VRIPSLGAAIAVAALSLAACSGSASAPTSTPLVLGGPVGSGAGASAPSIIPILISNSGELVPGKDRLLFSFIDARNNPVGAPDRTAKITVYDLARDASKPVSSAVGTFVWAIENERGVYVATVDFPEAGTYAADFTTAVGGGPAETIRMTFDVEATSPVVQVGARAPASKTPTAADVGGDLARISTDPKPDPAFYRTSIDQALATDEPFVVIFATPRFCVSAQCGPTLDRIKPFPAKYPTVDFIHVEPYQLTYANGQLQPVLTAPAPSLAPALTPSDVTNAWGLLTEPWVFVVDKTGIVRGSFEVIFSDAELTSVLDSVK
jgi:hypothetical protein